jgi:hypothetical protein
MIHHPKVRCVVIFFEAESLQVNGRQRAGLAFGDTVSSCKGILNVFLFVDEGLLELVGQRTRLV